MQEAQTKYQALINCINEQIVAKALRPGDKLPSENELAEQFHISRQTVRKAIGVLEEDGVVCRVKGSGTYLNYYPQENPEQKNNIAVITTYVESYIFPKTIHGIEKVLSESGYSVQISFTNNTLEKEKSILEDLLARNDVAGVIVEGTKSGLPNPNIHLYRKLIAKKLPVLFINTYYPELDVPHVSLNDVSVAKKAVNYLIQNGHRDIGAILKLDDGQGRQRYLGYLSAMEAAGYPVTDSRMVWIDTDESKQLAYCTDKILNRLEGCTALLCYNDQIAFQLVRILMQNGIKVPEDVSIISIDDSDLARHSEVPITSLTHPKEELGAKAAEVLLQLIAGRKNNATFEFDTRVMERESVKNVINKNI
ncbi:MAG: GntR family transcriptional regulator [Lachnospiraceae bacterium]|nr:GntR family transcriptional regulator [Lachnospiraceae bacterium]